MRQAGLLGEQNRKADPLAAQDDRPPSATIVASPTELRAARTIDASRSRNSVPGLDVPVFHIGELEWQQQDAEDAENAAPAEVLWPLFFGAADVDSLWEKVGGDRPMPQIQVTDLGDAVEWLREYALGAAGGRPMLCAPLDAADFLRTLDHQTFAVTDAASSAKGGRLPPLNLPF